MASGPTATEDHMSREHEPRLCEETFIEQNAALFLKRSAPCPSCEQRTLFYLDACGLPLSFPATVHPLDVCGLSGIHLITADPKQSEHRHRDTQTVKVMCDVVRKLKETQLAFMTQGCNYIMSSVYT